MDDFSLEKNIKKTVSSISHKIIDRRFFGVFLLVGIFASLVLLAALTVMDFYVFIKNGKNTPVVKQIKKAEFSARGVNEAIKILNVRVEEFKYILEKKD